MAIDNTTVNQGYELPHPGNTTAHDVERIIAALTAIDMDVATLVGALLLKATLESPAFSGTPTAPTQPAGTNNNTLATTGHVQLALNAFLSEAASALETISALEAALGDADLATALLDQLALKAPLASPALTGIPSAPTAATSDSSTQLATTAFVQAVKALIMGAPPSVLDTLQKQAAAIGNDASFAATMSTALGLKAPLASPAFTGSPTAPTQALGDTSTKLATTGFVQAALGDYDADLTTFLATKAPLASPALTGTPTAPTQAAGNNTTRIATTAFVTAADNALNTAITTALGFKAPLASPALTGTPTAPTATTGTNTTQLATTAFVQAAIAAVNAAISSLSSSVSSSLALKAPLSSPALTGTPTAPTQTAGNNSTRIATTAFVKAAVDAVSIDVGAETAALAVGAVGSYAMLKGQTANEGTTKAGSGLTYSNGDGGGTGGSPSGTWMCVSRASSTSIGAVWKRIS